MAEYSANAVQIVNPGETIVFTEVPVADVRNNVRHRDNSGNFLLSGWLPNTVCGCKKTVNYLVDFGCNISIPEGGTVGEIAVAIDLDGATLPSSIMRVTPAAVDEYFNVSRAINVDIWRGCCETVTVRNVSDQPIQVESANIIFNRQDTSVRY